MQVERSSDEWGFYFFVIWQMFYRFGRALMWLTFKIFFRRIDVVGLDKLQKGNPSILIANHPASFLDAMVLAVFLRRSLYFYVRGDIFSHPLAYRILTILHMIPIYSREHGTGNLERNKRTFERGRKLLSQGKLLLIFPEGFSRQSKQLETFKKGAARVALQTAFDDGFAGELYIQTVAINYSSHSRGAHLFIRVGENMTMSSFREIYQAFPAQAINQLNAAMQQLFVRNVIHVADSEHTAHAEFLMNMLYHLPGFEPGNFFNEARLICQAIDSMDEIAYKEQQDLLANYRFRLMKYPLNDLALSQPQLSLHESIKLIVLFPVFAAGVISGVLPLWASQRIAAKTVTRIDFFTSVHSGVLGFAGLIWWILISVFAGLAGGIIWTIPFLFTPVYWLGAWHWWQIWEKLSAKRNFNYNNNLDPQFVRGLLQVRQKLIPQ
jgi:1-acyl-sn-glycerol-3-phosphate acyltransferase